MVEKLKVEDLSEYKSLIDDCFGSSQNASIYRSNYKADSNYKIYVAKDNGKIVGAITIVPVDLFTFANRPFLMLFDVCTRSSHRRHGVATELMKFVVNLAGQNGYRSISLTCLESEKNVHSFYEKMGFQKTASLKYNLELTQDYFLKNDAH